MFDSAQQQKYLTLPHTAELGYNDLGLCDTSVISSYIQWHQLIPPQDTCLPASLSTTYIIIYLEYNDNYNQPSQHNSPRSGPFFKIPTSPCPWQNKPSTLSGGHTNENTNGKFRISGFRCIVGCGEAQAGSDLPAFLGPLDPWRWDRLVAPKRP